jgi:3-phosphoshikimate 1-carboxyvinyltransferase
MKAQVLPCQRLEGLIHPPSSKNYTTRYLLIAALAEGESLIRFPAVSDDAEAMIRCCRALGAEFEQAEDGLRVQGFGRSPQSPGALNPGNAGAVMRFLFAPAVFLREVKFVTNFHHSLGKRPQGPLLEALEQIGIFSTSVEGHLPITLFGGHPRGGYIQVSGSTSSQYLSCLLFLAPLLEDDSEIEVTGGLKSKPAVRTTLAVLREAGIKVEASSNLLHFHVPGGQQYQAGTYTVPGDYPGASAILSAAAVVPSEVTVDRLRTDDEQGEKAIVDVLEAMGADISRVEDRVTIKGGRELRGTEFDGDQATDAVLAMCAAAALARGRSRFFNVENLRYKECDRISDFRAELLKVGVRTQEKPDEILIIGNPNGYVGKVEIDAHHDHRLIMALTIIGFRCEHGLSIWDCEQVGKSYPGFFDDLRSLGATIEETAAFREVQV